MGLRTPLFAVHQSAGARMVDFGGWEMPVVYSSIVSEHSATRGHVGIFDICHMGRILVTGADSVPFLDHVLTNQVANLQPSQIRYSLVLNDAGLTLDDVLVYRLADRHMVVVNASNREKIMGWFREQAKGYSVDLDDKTFSWGMLAVQGPKAIEVTQPLVAARLASLGRYFTCETTVLDKPAIVSRTGYTGEDGYEILLPSELVESAWRQLTGAGAIPNGLGARDTLRLEAGLPLYGHELTEDLDPVQAGLGWAVASSKKDFVGKTSLLARDPNRPVRVGLQLTDKRIARDHCAVLNAGQKIGWVTSGTFAPTLSASIAMAYVDPSIARPDTQVQVVVREQPIDARVARLPFYKRRK